MISQEQTGERANWFVHDRFGMFIHWGVYSGAEGHWKGEKLRYDNDYAEWIQYRNRISKEEYLTLLGRFDWASIDPEEWVLLAKKAGMKYVTITSKHHDGFALWDSDSNEYNISNYSESKRDIIKELSEACKKHGLKLGLYYSHWVDWEHEYGWDHTDELSDLNAQNYDEYWQEKVMPQMKELLTNYGDIGIIWFDMWIHHSKTIVTKEQLFQLKSLIRELQPNCLINSRLGLSIEEDSDVDFRTMGDNQLGTQKLEYPWQTSGTVAHSWGFHSKENQWKSTTTLLKSLINNVSLNGNFMLNIGPRANGEVPYEISSRLEDIGAWLEVNGESIYGAGAYDLKLDQHDWGNITYKKTEKGKHKLFLHLPNWPLEKQIEVTGMTSTPKKIYLLADKNKSPLKFSHSNVLTKLDLPMAAPDKYVSVIVMEFDHKPRCEKDLVASSNFGGYSLTPNNYLHSDGEATYKKPDKFGSIPGHTIIKQKQEYTWKIFAEGAGSLMTDISYSFQSDSEGGFVTVKVNGVKIKHIIIPTGKTIGEPGQDWVIDNYNSFRLGAIQIDKAGFYEIAVEIQPKSQNEVLFQWIWVDLLTN